MATQYAGMLRNGLNRAVSLFGPLGTFGAIAFVLARVGDFAMLATRVALGRYLPDVDFGAIDPILSTLTLLSFPAAILCQSATKAISSLNAREERQQCSTLIQDFSLLILTGGIITALLVLLLGPVLLSRLHMETHQSWFPLFLAAWVALAWWQQLFAAIFQGLQRYVLLSVIGALSPIILALLTFIFVVLWNNGLAGALITRLASGLLALLVSAWFLRSFISRSRASYRNEWPSIRQTLLPASLLIVSTILLLTFDRLFVRNFLQAESGGFGAIITLGQIPMWFLLPLVTILLPLASAEHAVGTDVSKWLTQAIVIGTVVTAGSALILELFAAPIFRCWKPSFLPYAGLVWPYALAMGLNAVILIVVNVEFARHEYGAIVWMAIVSVAACVALYWLRASVSLPVIIWAQAGIRMLVLAGILPLIWWRVKGRVA